MSSFARATLEHPALFDTLQPVRHSWRRKLCKEEISTLAKLADINGLASAQWDEREGGSGRAQTMHDGFTGQGRAQLAHMLPDSEAQNPAIYLASRLLGVFKWDGSDELDAFKSSLRNLFPLTEAKRTALNHDQTFIMQPLALPLLVVCLEEGLVAEEMTVSGDAWHWDTRSVIADFSLQLTQVRGLPVAPFRPVFLPSCPGEGIDTITYHDKHTDIFDYRSRSECGNLQTHRHRVPTTLPVSYRKDEDVPSWLDPDPDGHSLPAKLSFVDTFLVNMLSYQAVCHRQQLYTTGFHSDLFFDRHHGTRVTQEFRDYLRLMRYVVDLVFSETPSSFRMLERPNELLSGIQPPAAAQTSNSTPRKYCWEKVSLTGSSSKAEDPHRRSSSPFRRPAFPKQWQELLIAGVKEVELADMDETVGQGTQPDDPQDQWQQILERLHKSAGDYGKRLERLQLTQLDVSRATLSEAEASLMADFKEAARHASPKALIVENWELVPGAWEYGRLHQSLMAQLD